MKRQPIPQFEFGFSGDSFALVPERQEAKPVAPQIMAEMTEAERERLREQSKATMPGLAPGSSWTMAKALATMQRGAR